MSYHDRRPYVSRAGHRKSRRGCLNCKQRRVKCDETKPKCQNCARRSLSCAYAAPLTTPPVDSDALSNDDRNRSFPSPTRPPQANTVDEPLPDASPRVPNVLTPEYNSPAAAVGLNQSHTLLSEAFDLFDMKILHHYSQHLGPLLAKDGRNPIKWTTDIPAMAFGNTEILRALLALSALHLAGQTPESGEKQHCRDRAAYHYSLALPAMIGSLNSVSAAQGSTMFVSAVLLSLHYFASGPRPGQYVAFSDAGEAEGIRLLRGVRSISESSRPPALRDWLDPNHPSQGGSSNSIASTPVSDAAQQTPVSVRSDVGVQDFQQRLMDLKRFVAGLGVESDQFDKYTVALNTLEKSYLDTFVSNVNSGEGTASRTSQEVFSWLYRMQPDFLAALERKRPLALVVFAYWVTLLFQFRDLWYLEGWSEHIMDGIYKHLHIEYRNWLQWPVQVLAWTPRNPDQEDV